MSIPTPPQVCLDAECVRSILSAVSDNGVQLREMQATAKLPDSVLAATIDRFNGQAVDEEWLALQAQLLKFYDVDNIPALVKQMSNDITMLQQKLKPYLVEPPSGRAPREG